jgi:hypothetical protein
MFGLGECMGDSKRWAVSVWSVSLAAMVCFALGSSSGSANANEAFTPDELSQRHRDAGAMPVAAPPLLEDTQIILAATGPDFIPPTPLGSRERVIFDAQSLPGRLSESSVGPFWEKGIELERAERFLASAQQYEQIILVVPEEEYTYWRIARNYWRHAEALPTEASDTRLVYFERATEWADRGLVVNPDCGACMLWKFVSLGRQATTRGLLSAVSDAREMNRLLSRGIELQPGHRDNSGNSTLGNLYYAASVFYRIVPDWWWLRVFVGVQGDKARSVRYARRAVESSPVRVDYRIELGASLLCLGTVERQSEPLAEGVKVLRTAMGLPDYLRTDAVDREHAQVLLGAPEKACGYSRDGFIDVDALGEQARAGEAGSRRSS